MRIPGGGEFDLLAAWRGHSVRYRANMARDLARLFDLLARQGIEDVQAVEEQHLVAFARHLAERKRQRDGQPLMASTRKNSLSRIRSFFAYLERSGVILRNPARDLPLPKVSSLPRVVLTVGQAGQLMRAPGGLLGLRDRAILEVLYGSGLRRSECARIEMTDLDLAEGTLLVRDGKGGRDRYVPMTGSAMRAVDEYLRRVRDLLTKDAREQGLFLSRLRKRLTACGLDRVVKRHGRAVGVSLSPHALRHACATHLLKGGASIRHVQAILGHKNLNTTAVYTRVLAEDLKQVVRRSHPREREVE